MMKGKIEKRAVDLKKEEIKLAAHRAQTCENGLQG